MKKLAWPRRMDKDTALKAEALEWEEELYSTLREELKNMRITDYMIYESTFVPSFLANGDWVYERLDWWLLKRWKLYSRILGGGYSSMNAYGYRQMRIRLERIQSKKITQNVQNHEAMPLRFCERLLVEVQLQPSMRVRIKSI